MQLPTPLSRRNKNTYKNQCGHVLVIAGSKRMLGAAALSSLAALRTGAGLVTAAVPQSLNATFQKKVSNCVMSLPLKETKEQSISSAAFTQIKNTLHQYQAIAIGPGLSQNQSTKKFVTSLIKHSQIPLILDADALNLIADNPAILTKTKTLKICTPHTKELARLLHDNSTVITNSRKMSAEKFANTFHCVLLLKGHQTLICAPHKRTVINKTGNPGMATAGSGDVLTGMIAALVGCGIEGFQSAKLCAHLHGLAGDLAAKKITQTALMATDLIDAIPQALKKIKAI
ncbi:NAD(P)H-hydrate dehydratase [Candidatus Omnitrophota bacterium]